MYKDKNILLVIPARGGSKRLPGKNIKFLDGKPLIAYAIEAGKGSKYVDRIVVTTDDEEIARVSKEIGADVPFMRPAELATDEARVLPVMQHAVAALEITSALFDAIVLIQPTVPGVLPADVDAAIEKFFDAEADSCVSVCEITERPELMFKVEEDGTMMPYTGGSYTPVREMPPLYRINGAVYVTKRSVLMEDGKIYDEGKSVAVMMPRERSVDIDTLTDFVIAELLFSQNKLTGNF